MGASLSLPFFQVEGPAVLAVLGKAGYSPGRGRS